MTPFAQILDVKRRIEPALLALPGVHSVGIGGKVSGGRPIGEFAIRLQVHKKKPLDELRPEERIPAEIEGVKTDVVESTPPVPYQLEGGIEIFNEVTGGGLVQRNTGTLGCFARTLGATPKVVLLSNDHVLYGKTPPRLNNGDEVKISGCCCDTTIARLLTTSGSRDPLVDAAIADVDAGQKWLARVRGVSITGTLDLRPQNIPQLPPNVQTAIANHTYRVHKSGATTDRTHGRIVDVDVSTQVIDDSQGPPVTVNRTEQMQVLPLSGDYFSLPGDSGSAIYNDAGQVIALLWGGGGASATPPVNTIGCHIVNVETKLQIKIASNDPAVVYRVGGEPLPHPAWAHLYSGLSASGRQRAFKELYARHHAEVKSLLEENRAFRMAWHRNHGPRTLQSLRDLFEQRSALLPETIEGRSWADCVDRISEAAFSTGSVDLRASIDRYRTLLSRLGGRTQDEVLGFLLDADRLTRDEISS